MLGNFSYYLYKKAERQEQLASSIDKAKNTFRTELEWIRKQPKARGTKQKARIDAFLDVKNAAKLRRLRYLVKIGKNLQLF